MIMYRGIAKLLEESGELAEVLADVNIIKPLGRLTTVLGKIMAYPTGPHPDERYNTKPLRERLLEELADVRAAIDFFCESNLSTEEQTTVSNRIGWKIRRYRQWSSSVNGGMAGVEVKDPPDKEDRLP